MAAAREDWERVDALLQDKSEDIDLDYINTVCTHTHTYVHTHTLYTHV